MRDSLRGVTDEELAAIELRDQQAAGGLAAPDYTCAADRHALVLEVVRLRELVARLRTGRPTA